MNEPSNSSSQQRSTPWGQLTAGLILAGLGVLLLVTEAGWLSGVDLYRLWPLIVVAVGVVRLLGGGPDERVSGYITLFIGCWLLTNTLNLYGLYWGNSWPLPMVAVGLALLLGGSGRERMTGIFMMLVGAVFLSMTTDVLGLGFQDTWPLALIFVGLWIVVGAFGGGSCGSKGKEAPGERN